MSMKLYSPARRIENMYSIPDQSGKIFIITGSNSGLGKEAALRLAEVNAQIIMAVRNIDKGEAAKQEILQKFPAAQISLEELDLSSLTSVAAFAERIKQNYTAIDVLINNAGVMTPPSRHETQDGFELQFGTNYLGHFALTYQLLPLLLAAEKSRVVTVSSVAAMWGRVRLDDLEYKKRFYIPTLAYGQSKLADSLLAVQLAHLAQTHGWNLISVSAHPGFTRTNLQYAGANLNGKKSLTGLLNNLGYFLYSQSVEIGTEPVLVAATSPQAQNNEYFGPSGIFQLKGSAKQVALPPRARNQIRAQQLYYESLALTGLKEEDFLPDK